MIALTLTAGGLLWVNTREHLPYTSSLGIGENDRELPQFIYGWPKYAVWRVEIGKSTDHTQHWFW
jgi:hypothetical protein